MILLAACSSGVSGVSVKNSLEPSWLALIVSEECWDTKGHEWQGAYQSFLYLALLRDLFFFLVFCSGSVVMT